MPHLTRDELFVVRVSRTYPEGSSAVDRFWPRVDVRGPDECWPWIGAHDQRGYGQLGIGSGKERTHRISWVITNGDLAEGLIVLHSCDNPPCCNPVHLSAGTALDNAADMVRRGRVAVGERCGRPRLTEDNVREMRRRFAAWASVDELAQDFGVGPVTVWRAVSGAGWKHVTDVPPAKRPPRSGMLSPRGRFSDDDIAEMRRRWQAGGVTQRAMAKEYACNLTWLNQVLNGKVRP